MFVWLSTQHHTAALCWHPKQLLQESSIVNVRVYCWTFPTQYLLQGDRKMVRTIRSGGVHWVDGWSCRGVRLGRAAISTLLYLILLHRVSTTSRSVTMLSMLRWCWRKATPWPAPWSRSACRAASLSTCTSPEMSSSWRQSRTIPSARSSGGIWRRCTWKTNYLCYPSSKLLSLKPTLQKKLLYNDGVQVFEADLQCLILSIVIKEFSLQLFTCKSIQQKELLSIEHLYL